MMRRKIQAPRDSDEIVQDLDLDPMDVFSLGEEESTQKALPPFVVKFREFLQELTEKSKWAELTDRSLCHRCKDQPDDPWVTECQHVYCQECLTFLATEASENSETRSACLQCGHFFAESHPCGGIRKPDLRKDSISATAVRQNKKSRKKDVEWLKLDGKLLLSTKASAIQTQIRQWLQEDPNKKIIIFSQFYQM